MTEVKVQYAAGQNVSVTVRGGRIDKVTTWTTGVPGSTKRTTALPKRFKK